MHAMTLMVERGMKIPAAAKEAGMQYESLRLALKRPHVHEALTRLKHAWRDQETAASWVTVADLRDKSVSDEVRLKAARTFLGAAGELEPDRGAQGNGGALVQILFAGQPQQILANDQGVFEVPTFGGDR